ncbi:MAG TPA: hypothetical protein VGO54_13920 [Bradyrhizobium sp.]|jgi:hypothetical protein|nr:hypothetical protein [Bradyrhizobium sp.]
MATKNRFPLDDHIPLFLADYEAEPEQSGIWRVISSRILKTIVWVFAAGAIVFAIASIGSPTLFASVTASQIGASAPEEGKGQSIPAVQSTASAEALPVITNDAPSTHELLAAFESAFERPSAVDQPPAETSLKRFEAWAGEQAARAEAPRKPAQDARGQVAQKKAQVQPLPKPRPVQAEQIAPEQDPVENAQWPARKFGWRN